MEARIVTDGTNTTKGRVEVFSKGRWGSICNDTLSPKTVAQVACRMVNSNYYGRPIYNEVIPGNNSIVFGALNCRGNESSLFECEGIFKGDQTSCGFDHNREYMVQCEPKVFGSAVIVPNSPGSNNNTGRVEIVVDNRWTTICGEFLGSSDIILAAQVICRQIGYGKGRLFGCPTGECHQVNPGTGPIHVKHLQCSGIESEVSMCNYTEVMPGECDHSQDMMIECWNSSAGDIRIASTSQDNPFQGRLEVFDGNEWGTTCDDIISPLDLTANVACRELGLGTGALYGCMTNQCPLVVQGKAIEMTD